MFLSSDVSQECEVALGVRGTTLMHRMTPSGHDWFTQLVEVFTLLDYDIPGYTPLKVITELHVHAWRSSVDYRPLRLPYRAFLTLESFTVSSNVLAESSTSLLRFLVEGAALFVSDRADSQVHLKQSECHKQPPVYIHSCDYSAHGSIVYASVLVVVSDYVCVADMDMFEVALRTSDGTDVCRTNYSSIFTLNTSF